MPPHIRCILSTRCILTHSHSYAFKRIQMHSLAHAFRCIHSHTHSLVYADAVVCIRVHSYAFACIRMHSYTFVCICMHSHACSLLRNIQPNFEYLVLCSDGQPHTVAVTALFITDAQCVPGRRSFDRYYLETLLEKEGGTAHRPRTPSSQHSCWDPHPAD